MQGAARRAALAGARRGNSSAAAQCPRPGLANGSHPAAAKLYEIRTYQLKPDRMTDYLQLTGSAAFNPRLAASKMNGFFIVEMGGVLNSVVHFWEYDDLHQRTRVRAALAKNPEFGKYLAQIRQMLVTQASVLSVGGPLPEVSRPEVGVYAFEHCAGGAADTQPLLRAPGIETVGTFRGLTDGGSYTLLRADNFQALIDDDAGVALQQRLLMHPAPFSPMQ
eukprot:TRINITY_DN64858_c0_g1_i1.p1 TRINITY_DN64858_c0_g1~~TRINITY_DN64858_c0_g1_i1.p1  ORF type:complete len:221 (+),score=59.49 TRINITY_DN64858_c0_g1_i1:75-737(+)